MARLSASPALPTFPVDELTAEVCDLIRSRFARHPGTLRPEALAASREDAERAWAWAKSACLPFFGPFEDAMSSRERTLFHTRISPLLNLSRLTARQLTLDVIDLDLPLESKEGFVRQILGWREYMHHLHEATDGLRFLRGEAQTCATGPGDGGYVEWKTTCPLTPMYWAFLERHRDDLAGVDRMRLPLASAARRSAADRARDAAVFDRVASVFRRGEPVDGDR